MEFERQNQIGVNSVTHIGSTCKFLRVNALATCFPLLRILRNPILFKLATRYRKLARDSLRNVTINHQRRFASDHLRAPQHHFTNSQTSSGPLNDQIRTPKDSKALSSRRSSYLAICNFFTNNSGRQQGSDTVPSLPRRSHFSTSCLNHFRSSAPTQATNFGGLTREEEEWLQNSDILALATSSGLGPRFNWRMRATSQTAVQGHVSEDGKKPRSIKRIAPLPINVKQGEPFFEEIQAYSARYVFIIIMHHRFPHMVNRFLPLLEAEQIEDEAVLKERLSNWSLARLREEGYCLTDMAAFWLDAPQFGRPVASFALGPGLALPEHRFEYVSWS